MKDIKGLEKTFIYKYLNGSTKRVSTNMLGILKSDGYVPANKVEEALLTIRKNYKYAAKPDVLKAVESGDIYMYYAPDDMKLPAAIPFFLTEMNNKIVAIVLVDQYGVRDKETKEVAIDPKKLYVLLEGAHFARLYYTRHSSIVSPTSVIGEGSKVYAAMLARIFNKKYALNRDKNRHSGLTYLASKFFMINMLQMSDGDTVSNYAYRNTATPNKMFIEQLDDLVNEEEVSPYTDISTFIHFVAKPEVGLKFDGLTVSAFLNEFITMYYGEMLLSLEYFPLFLHNVNAVTNSGYINNQYILEDIIEKSGPKIYNAVSLVK